MKLLIKAYLSKDLPAYIKKKSTREKKPRDYFLDQENRKYPWKTATGKPSRDLLIAAKKRAAQYHKKKIYDKADRLLKRYFPEKDKK